MSEPINAEKRSQLSAAKQALLAKRLRGQLTAVNKSENQEREAVNSLPQIAPNPETRHLPFPLTDMQQAYWIGRNSFFESGNVSIHAYFETDSQNLDLDRFNRAWQRLIERHDMLKAIVLPDGQQQILENLPPYEIKVVDLRGKSEEVIADELQAVRDRLSHQVIPSDRWPLYEICASQLGDRHYRLHISIDGIFFDARSYQILSKELIHLYQDPDCTLPPLNLSFRDYVQGLLDLQTSDIYQKSLTYWQQRIPTLPPAPELPLANTGAAPQGSQFVRRRSTLDAEIWQKLKTRAARANVTPAGLLLAAYAEVLATWSKNPRFTINVPRFDRFPLHPQVNHLIGEFASFTLLEVDFSEPNSFEVRAKRLQQQLWQDLEHQYVSGVRVLRELARYQGNTLGVTMPIVFTSSPQDVNGKETTPVDAPVDLGAIAYSLAQTPQVWLDFMYRESNGALIFNFDAVENRFAPGVVEAMFQAYSKLLTCLAEGEEGWQEIGRSLVPEEQLQQRAAINATDAPMPDTTLYQLFCDRVQEAPEQVAINTSDCTLTYAEVYERSQHLGYRLRELGARPNTLVAVFMEKGWEQIVAVLGILAAGAAYLPLDPELPQERLDYLLQDGEVHQVLTQSQLLGTRVLPAGIQPICVDGQDLSRANSAPLPSLNTADDLAYVIYTSGSTGLPKGVAIAHRSVVNTVIATNQRFEITASDRAIALTALHHDLSVFDIFGILAAGGTLVIPDAVHRRDPAHWSQLLQQERVTFWNSVPAMMEMLLEYTHNQPNLTFPDLRLTILGGDWLPVALPNRLKAAAPNVQLVSIGGPTETTIWNIWYPVETVSPQQKSIPYGKPTANNRYYILNDALEDRPVWVPGQMYCAGVGLAQGYWRNDAKTLENFITHPRTGERLYRTGDMGRYLPDGNIEFLSRVDFQMKIRGHRIEPGEIESTVIQHPAVRSTVVVAVGNQADRKQLVAYVVPENPPTPELAEELRYYLSEKLPPYMVPATVMVLEALPLTPNGKVDRRGLPTPEHLEPGNTFIPPRTATEKQLAQIWREVLNCDRVGIRDNFFFDLGGHSLLATQVMSRVRQSFEVDVPLMHFFETPTIEDFSLIVTQKIAEKADSDLLEQTLFELEELSDEEVQSLLANSIVTAF